MDILPEEKLRHPADRGRGYFLVRTLARLLTMAAVVSFENWASVDIQVHGS